MISTNAPLSLLQKEVYDAQQAVQTKGSEDDVQLINDPDGSNEPDTTNSQKDTGTPGSLKRKRARGRPRKHKKQKVLKN
jgi:hypothetical protein